MKAANKLETLALTGLSDGTTGFFNVLASRPIGISRSLRLLRAAFGIGLDFLRCCPNLEELYLHGGQLLEDLSMRDHLSSIKEMPPLKVFELAIDYTQSNASLSSSLKGGHTHYGIHRC